MSKKGLIILTIVLSILGVIGVVLVAEYWGTTAMLAYVLVIFAIANLIIAIEHEKLNKKVKELEQKVDELTKNYK